MAEWSAVCEECDYEWDSEGDEDAEPPDNCPECGSYQVLVEAS